MSAGDTWKPSAEGESHRVATLVGPRRTASASRLVAATDSAFAKGRVLVVEPEPIVVELIERRLRGAGFDTSSASSATEAVRVAAERLPDVILLALALPDANGLATLTRLRSMPELEGVSIAMMATVQRDSDSYGGLELGADDYLRKPIDQGELIGRVRSLHRLRRQIAELKRQNSRLAELNGELERIAIRDPLTSIFNRRYLEQRLGEEVERAWRYKQPLSLLVVDVDHFKNVNDTFGHLIGDVVLRGVAGIMQRSIRRIDLLSRYGGEEFVIVAPSTDKASACQVAERVRTAIAVAPIFASGGSGAHATVRVTVSIGVATFAGHEATAIEDIMAAADAAVYRAKKNGRNRVEFGEPIPAPGGFEP